MPAADFYGPSLTAAEGYSPPDSNDGGKDPATGGQLNASQIAAYTDTNRPQTFGGTPEYWGEDFNSPSNLNIQARQRERQANPGPLTTLSNWLEKKKLKDDDESLFGFLRGLTPGGIATRVLTGLFSPIMDRIKDDWQTGKEFRRALHGAYGLFPSKEEMAQFMADHPEFKEFKANMDYAHEQATNPLTRVGGEHIPYMEETLPGSQPVPQETPEDDGGDSLTDYEPSPVVATQVEDASWLLDLREANRKLRNSQLRAARAGV